MKYLLFYFKTTFFPLKILSNCPVFIVIFYLSFPFYSLPMFSIFSISVSVLLSLCNFLLCFFPTHQTFSGLSQKVRTFYNYVVDLQLTFYVTFKVLCSTLKVILRSLTQIHQHFYSQTSSKKSFETSGDNLYP